MHAHTYGFDIQCSMKATHIKFILHTNKQSNAGAMIGNGAFSWSFVAKVNQQQQQNIQRHTLFICDLTFQHRFEYFEMVHHHFTTRQIYAPIAALHSSRTSNTNQ